MKLFKYEGFQIKVEPEALLLKPFKAIWVRDKSHKKDKAMMELGFIYFFADPRSDYMYLVDDASRIKAIKEGEGFSDDWKIDSVLENAIKFYKSFLPMSALLLEDTRIAVDKLRTLLRTIDYTQTDDKNKPIYTLNTITATIKQIPGLIEELDKTEKALSQELVSSVKARGQGELTVLDENVDI